MGDVENSEIPCTPWTTRMPKYAQPNLNYIGKKKKIDFFETLFFHLISYITSVYSSKCVTVFLNQTLQTMYAQRAKLYSIPRKLDIPNSTLFIVIKKINTYICIM